jgi:tetratricopeptide (TPR) repeat protein
VSALVLAAQASDGGGGATTIAVVALSVLLVALLAGVLLYAKVLLPRKRRKPVVEAIALTASEDEEDLGRAEALLVEAVTTGLRKRDLADARFALAYVRARLEKYREAATTAAELRESGGADAETLYLELWLQSKLDNHERVRELYEEHAGALGGLLQTDLIASISYLHLARERWRRKEVDGALHLFERIRALDQLADRLPGHVDDLQIVNGVQAIFDGRIEDARRAFEGASARLSSDGRESVPEAELGVVLCDWRSQDLPDVDGRLGAILAALETRSAAAPAAGALEAESEEAALLRAHAALLHTISLLFTWLTRLPPRQGLPSDSHEELRGRVERVREHDPELGDGLLIEGLIGYYFAASEDDRSRALATLEEGTGKSKAILLPEVLDLIERERRLEREVGDALNRYLALARSYLADDGVPVELRDELRRRLERLGLHGELAELELGAEEHAVAPSVEDIRHRGALLRRRIGALVRPRLRAEEGGARELETLLERLEGATDGLAASIGDLERAEQALMLRTGEFLLPEEDRGGG